MISLSLARTNDPRQQTDFASYQPATLKNFESVICTDTWSPLIWRDGRRLKSHFESAEYFALDFDSGTTLREMLDFCLTHDLAHIIGTTKSHGKEKRTASGKLSPACDRFRLLFKADSPCTDRELYEYNMGLMVDYFGCDPSCTDAARFFYPCTEIVSARVKGKRLPWKPFDLEYVPESQRFARRAARLAAQGKLGIPPKWLADILRGAVEIPEGTRHMTAYRIGCNFAALGWDSDDAIAKVMKTSIGDIGDRDVRRCIENGFAAELGKIHGQG